MSSGQENVIHKATIEAPGHSSGAEKITLVGTGAEVFALAYAGYLIASDNGAQPALHFYVGNDEVPWRGVVIEMDAAYRIKVALEGLFNSTDYEDLPF